MGGSVNSYSNFRTAHSCAVDTRTAVREFYAGVRQPNMALVVFFCSIQYDLEIVADEMNQLFAGVPIAGCTTAGEIGPAGYRNHSLSGVSFSASACSVVVGHLDQLQRFEYAKGKHIAQSLLMQMESQASENMYHNSFAFLLIDGLSRREESVARALQSALGQIPLFGGSAGDDLQFAHTWVFHDGKFHCDSAILLLIHTNIPFKIFKTEHFVCEVERLVVTEADAGMRVIKEINGLPAADEYARAIGVPVHDLTPQCFAAAPVVVAINGTSYVRSIQKANQDGSLAFYCAIDEGLVLRAVRGVDLIGNLQQALDSLRVSLGPLQLVIACDCVHRNLELTQKGLKDEASDIFCSNHTVGFSTYGEQYRGMHVNQTLTGIAFGLAPHV